VSRRVSRPAASMSNISSSSTKGPSPSSHTHERWSPVPVKLQYNTLVITWMKAIDPDHCAWGLASSTASHFSAKDSDIWGYSESNTQTLPSHHYEVLSPSKMTYPWQMLSGHRFFVIDKIMIDLGLFPL
jgi:hypothetical protein